MLAAVPARKPDYANPRISSYHYLCRGRRGRRAGSLLLWPFAHPANSQLPRPGDRHPYLLAFHCLEEGGGVEAFRADLAAALRRCGSIWESASQASCFHATKSVPPIWRSAANSACVPFAVTSAPGSTGPGAIASRIYSYVDAAWPTATCRSAGPHDREPALVGGMVDVPASRFLRPVSGNARWSACAFGASPQPWKRRRVAEGFFIYGGIRTISGSTYKKIWHFFARSSIIFASCRTAMACAR